MKIWKAFEDEKKLQYYNDCTLTFRISQIFNQYTYYTTSYWISSIYNYTVKLKGVEPLIPSFAGSVPIGPLKRKRPQVWIP